MNIFMKKNFYSLSFDEDKIIVKKKGVRSVSEKSK